MMRKGKICDNCKWFRTKAWTDEGSSGICDNPKVIEQVSMFSLHALESAFIRGENPEAIKSNAMAVRNSIRFHGNFGCINFEKP